MKKLVLLIVLFVFNATAYCGAQTKTTQKEKFESTYNALKTLVKSERFQYKGEMVYNHNGREKLDSNLNTISVNGTEILGLVTSFKSDNKAFDINGTLENYKVNYDDENQRITIQFKVNIYNVSIEVKPNGNAFLKVSNGLNSTINWTGKLE
jgi:hypothetical protein